MPVATDADVEEPGAMIAKQLLMSFPCDQEKARPSTKVSFSIIYALADPDEKQPRYIGVTTRNLPKRFAEHLHRIAKEDTHKGRWLRALAKDGKTPDLVVLEEGVMDWRERERYWIKTLRSEGAPLTNLTEGGEGTPGLRKTALTRMRLSITNTGKKLSRDRVEQMRNRVLSPATRARMSDVARRRRDSAETRTKKREAMKRFWASGYQHSAETLAKISAVNKGKVLSAETRAKLSATRTGKGMGPRSEEWRRNISKSLEGHSVSDEARAKMSAAGKGRKRSEAFKENLRRSSIPEVMSARGKLGAAKRWAKQKGVI